MCNCKSSRRIYMCNFRTHKLPRVKLSNIYTLYIFTQEQSIIVKGNIYLYPRGKKKNETSKNHQADD